MSSKSRIKSGVVITILIFLIMAIGTSSHALNPLFPTTAFIPDGEPHVFTYRGEKRLYVYGSRDERITGYCGYGHDVWSASVNDLTSWTNHGEIFHVKQVQDIGFGKVPDQHFGAPDCVYNPVTKKYYLYTFLGTDYNADGKQGPKPGDTNYVAGFGDKGPKCVMAQSSSPVGPFIDPVMCDWPAANEAGTFDPAAFVDEQSDGSVRVYVYWGMMSGDRWAEVDPVDMHTIIDSKTKNPDRNAWHKTLENLQETSLFEASSIRKITKDRYVFIYSANEFISALSYCYAKSPEGPWIYGGIIIDNANSWQGGNNHGSIVNINDQWYVFYHRSTCNDFNRQAMCEPIDLTIDGDKVVIRPVEMTSQGVETSGLNAFRRYNAGIVCSRTGGLKIAGNQRSPDGLNPVVGIESGNVLGYKYFNFGEAQLKDVDNLSLKLNISVLQNSSITVQVAPPEQANNPSKRVDLATYKLKKEGKDAFYEFAIPIKGMDQNEKLKELGGLKGKLAVFIVLKGPGGELCQIKELEFAKGNAGTPNPLKEIVINPTRTKCGTVTAIPSNAREGEGVKLSVLPAKGYKIRCIRAMDENEKKIRLKKNGEAPYAPRSFNFMMPASAVKVSTEFVVDK